MASVLAAAGSTARCQAAFRNPARTSLPKFVLLATWLLSAQLNRGEELSYCTQNLSDRYPSGWPQNLDTGIYWFGRGDASVKAVNGGKTPFYDPSRKTVIYFHGWTGATGGWTVRCKRATTRCPADVCPGDGGEFLVESWLADGWNVGFFYWDQFADEECARDAEQKIWFDRKGDGFRWKSFDPSTGVSTFRMFKEDAASITDICANAVKVAMDGFRGGHVRFVGHSLGVQIATRCAAMLHDDNHPAAPMRLALLEPSFSKHHLFFRCSAELTTLSTDSGLGDFAAQETAVYVKSLWMNAEVVTEIYKSSVLTESSSFGVQNEALERLGTLVEFEPEWCGGLAKLQSLAKVGPLAKADVGHLTCRQGAVFPMYFLGYGLPPPLSLTPTPANVSEPGSALSSCGTPSAACSDGEIREWITRQVYLDGRQKWMQISGKSSFNISDDAFELQPGFPWEDLSGLQAAGIINVSLRALNEESIAERHKSRLQRVFEHPHRVALACLLTLLVAVLVISLCCALIQRNDGSQTSDCSDSDGEGTRSLIMSEEGEEGDEDDKPTYEEKLADMCVCGQIFKEDSFYCRQCGSKRPVTITNLATASSAVVTAAAGGGRIAPTML